MDKYEVRRLDLIKTMNEHCNGKISELAKKLERSDSYVSRMLYEEGRPGKKRIGEDMADLIDSVFHRESSEKPATTVDVSDPRIAHALKLLTSLDPTQLDMAVNIIDTIAKPAATKGNGSK